jgi:tetratricopeptide (TPR) repeat protein
MSSPQAEPAYQPPDVQSVFISYTRSDQIFARSLAESLRVAGADAWFDENRLDVGELTPNLKKALECSRAFVVVCSPAALQSEWVRQEVEWCYDLYRHDRERVVLPIVIEALRVSDLWPKLRDFVRIEAQDGQPLPQDQMIRICLHRLGLTERRDPLNEFGAIQYGEDTARLYKEARALVDSGSFAEALPLARRAAEISVERVDRCNAWNVVGIALLQLGQVQGALDALDRAVAAGENWSAWHNRTIALDRLGRIDDALDANLKAIALSSDFDRENWPQYGGYRGVLLMKKDAYTDAMSWFEWTLHYDPQQELAMKFLAQSIAQNSNNLGSNQYNAGLERIRAYRQSHRDDPEGVVIEAHLLCHLGHYDEAATLLELNELNSSEYWVYWQALGQIYKKLHRCSEARTSYLRGIACEAADASNLWKLIAQCYLLEEDDTQAMSAIEESLALAPTPAVFALKASLLSNGGHLTEAAIAYRNALVSNPRRFEENVIRMNLAITLKLLGEFKGALAECDEVLKHELNEENREIVRRVRIEIQQAGKSI